MEEPKLNGFDLACIVLYFAFVLATGIFSMFRSNRGTISGYFLAGRFMTWLPVGASLFASNIGSEHFIGLAGSGAASGIGVGAFELNALIILQLLGWVFLPVYIASGVHTLPEYMCMRFGGSRIRIYLAFLSLMLYVFTKISVNIYSGALFVQVALGWDIYAAIFLVLCMTAICTVTGGLAAVIYTDTLQCFLMIFGASGLSIYSFIKVGGYSGLVEKYMIALPKSFNYTEQGNSTCGLPSPKAFTMLREPTDHDYPWPGFLLGQSPASIWYWAADQMMVQRTLASKSLSHAQGATLFAGYLKILPLFLIVMPGMISRVLFPDEIGCISNCFETCGNAVSCSNMAYPTLVVKLLPQGARGVMLAVMMSALMSDMTSIFNSSSTLFTIDIWRRIRRKASAKELLVVGRLWVLVMVVISLLWVPVVKMQQGGQLYIYIQAIAADLSPPIAAVYLLAILWKRTNETGAFWGLAVGFLVGVSRMVLEFVYVAPPCGQPDLRPVMVAGLHYMYFALLLFWITVIVVVVISLWTEPPESFRLIRTTFWTRKDQSGRPDDRIPEVDREKEIIEREEEVREMHPVVVQGQVSEPQEKTQHPERTEESCAGVWRYMTAAYNWFCGYDYSPKGRMKLLEFEAHLKEITTLEQTFWEKWVLNVNLIVIVAVAVFLYTFFSVGTQIKST